METSDKLKPESTDKNEMKGKDRLGDGSANWQFAPLDQRFLCQAQALSSFAQLRSMSDWGSGANCQFALPFSIAPFPHMFFI
jgi:hypothetical protein